MSSIEDVIARSRQPGQFSERKRFTVERSSAIRKMRKFALASPYYYILELIQAAIANGAEYIDIQTGSKEVALSYVGGGFTGEELAQLFDFLFASKDNLDLAHVRQLALGVNALMLSEPQKIVIESGSGTLESTTRVEIDGRTNTVDVGTPTQPLNGTFIRAEGMRRSRLGNGTEAGVIEARCVTSPVPILLNNEPVFGYRSMRTPNLMGYQRAVAFDEGDLYGTIGIATTENTNAFKLLTFGVWVESVKWTLVDGQRIGGVICFDRLRKTADHAGIVRDLVMEEMWARVTPYARQLAAGKQGQTRFKIRLLQKPKTAQPQPISADLKQSRQLDSIGIRDIAQNNDRVLVFTEDQIAGSGGELAYEFAEVLQAPILVANGKELQTLVLIASAQTEVLRPRLNTQELEFYRQPPVGNPPTPWIISPVFGEPTTVGQVREALEDQLDEMGLRSAMARLPRDSAVNVTIFTQVADRNPGKLTVEVRTVGRIVTEVAIPSDFPGHVLVLEINDVSPSALLHKERPHEPNSSNISELLAYMMAALVEPSLRAASQGVIEAANYRQFDPSSSATRIILAALTRGIMKSVHLDPPRIELRVMGDLPYELLNRPLFQTLGGEWRTLWSIAFAMRNQFGLIYGVLDGIEPNLDGLNTSEVLRLDAQQEAALVAIFGEAAYVRVDERDVLASEGDFRVRDIALGLQSYSSGPLLVEGDYPSDIQAQLVQQLIDLFVGDAPGDEEARRQAARHLIWFLINADEADYGGAEYLHLFPTDDGGVASWHDLREVFGANSLRMIDGWAVDAASLGSMVHWEPATVTPQTSLGMNTFIYMALAAAEGVRPTLEELENASNSDDFATDAWFNSNPDGDVSGLIGFPAEPPEAPMIAIIEQRSQKIWTLYSPGREIGLSGRLESKVALGEAEVNEIEAALMKRGADMLVEAFKEDASDPNADTMMVDRAMEFAGRHLVMSQGASRLSISVNSWEARQILSLPVFPAEHGGFVSAMRLVSDFAAKYDLDRSEEGWQHTLHDSAPSWIRKWCERFLTATRIVRPPSHAAAIAKTVAAPLTPPEGADDLAHWLTREIARLRPDPQGLSIIVHLVTPSPIAPSAMGIEWAGSKHNMGSDDLCVFIVDRDVGTLLVADHHWLVSNAIEQATPESRSWLMLACYAYVNEYMEPVTNEHELQFQAKVLAELTR